MSISGAMHDEAAAGVAAGLAAWRRPRASNQSRFSLFGVPIDRVSQADAVERVTSWIERRDLGRLICTPDTTAMMHARRDEALRSAYQSADLVTADGTGVVWASQFFGAPVAERVTGIDLMDALCRRAEQLGFRIFLLGSAPGVADGAKAHLLKKYPRLKIVGTHHGYFQKPDEVDLVEVINKNSPDLLFAGLGVPLQEMWLMENRDCLKVPVLMGVGGSFDVIAGRVARAPLSWQRLGLEWLWRVMLQPSRLTRVKSIPLFLVHLLFYKFLGWALNSV